MHGVRKARAFLLAATKRDASPNTETVQATTNGEKQRHTGADIEEFDYNIRNWTTRIKSGTFEEKLYYNTSVPENGSPCYNGNIAANTWTYNGQTNGYIYYYDRLNRLVSDYSILNNVFQVDYQFSESFSYDKHGNINFLNRGDNQDISDALTMTYNGNQVTNVIDNGFSQHLYNIKEYQNKADNGYNTSVLEFKYDKNGNMTTDLDRDIVTIRYNILNLPDTIQFKNGNQIINKYDASGRKLGTRYVTLLYALAQPLNNGDVLTTGVEVNEAENVTIEGTDYIDNIEYTVQRNFDFDVTNTAVDLRTINLVYNNEGYASRLTDALNQPIFSYYRRDQLGNIREVWMSAYRTKAYGRPITNFAASTVQRTQYYPSGLPWASNIGDNPSVQNKKYNGKEFVEMHGYDTYDYGARGYYAAIGRFSTIDRFAEKYYSLSPYSFAAGNPVNNIDINGDSLMFFENGKYLRTIDNGKTEMTGYNQESTKDENGNKTFTGGQSFSFNDIDVDRSDLTKKNNPMTLSFVSSNRIDNIIDKSGIKDQSVTSRYSYAANESNASNISGTGKMDYKMNFLGNNLYIINGIGYNMADAGNYVWGYAMGTMGFTSLMARSAAHLNAWWSAKQSNGEGSQNPNSIYRWIENRSWGGDAAADQRAIQNGLNDSGSYFTSKVRSIKRFFSF